MEDVPHIIFRALCDIDEGAELLYDYGDRHIRRRRAHLFIYVSHKRTHTLHARQPQQRIIVDIYDLSSHFRCIFLFQSVEHPPL